MSVYLDYTASSKNYDDGRHPQGAHLYAGLVYSLTNKTKENLHILDIGCGTGNHSKYLLDEGVKKITLLDANDGMLERAKEKLKDYIEEGRAIVIKHTLPEIPFEDNSFDTVMCNQVLQHLKSLEDKEFAKVVKLVNEAYRVLKPNGAFIVNVCSPFQANNGIWYAKLYPEPVAKFASRVMEPQDFLKTLQDAGFTKEDVLIEPLKILYKTDRYFNAEGPLHEEWRNVDSVSASLTPDELEETKNKITQMKKDGKLEKFFQEADSMRPNVGQYCIFYAMKA